MAVTETEVNFLKQTTVKLLKDAYQLHYQLGEEGKVVGSFNQFGESSLKADWEAEETVINGCRDAGISIVISSEEHGEVTAEQEPIYRGILDGIDGTNAYRMGTGSYGTMFAIYEGVNPRYRDYLVAGIIEYPTGRILIAARNQGAFILADNQSHPAATSNETALDPQQTRIFIDGGFEFNRRLYVPKFKHFSEAYLGNIDNRGEPWGVSSMYYFKLATGETDVVLECTRKRNLEIAVAFGILTEAGGVIVDGDGESIADRRYLEFGQGANEYLPVISAASMLLANKVVETIKVPEKSGSKPGLLTVRLDTIRMSQLSPFGQEIAIAKMRNTNPGLYRYLERLHPLTVELVSPFYNLILLEYELQRKRIPNITDKTLGEYNPPESEDELKIDKFEVNQPDLIRQVTNYLEALRSSDPLLADAAQFAIFDTLQLLSSQAEKNAVQ